MSFVVWKRLIDDQHGLTTTGCPFTMSSHQTTLTSLLPSTPYTLAYALPLLFLSVLLTFAGAFLTLDRTRSFPPRYDTVPGGFDTKNNNKNKSFYWLLEGGIGGLAIGYVFGRTSKRYVCSRQIL
jgi:hypothetical protein